jgi:hypothetical protein
MLCASDLEREWRTGVKCNSMRGERVLSFLKFFERRSKRTRGKVLASLVRIRLGKSR